MGKQKLMLLGGGVSLLVLLSIFFVFSDDKKEENNSTNNNENVTENENNNESNNEPDNEEEATNNNEDNEVNNNQENNEENNEENVGLDEDEIDFDDDVGMDFYDSDELYEEAMKELERTKGEEYEPPTPLEDIYGEEAVEEAIELSMEFIEIYNNVDGSKPNNPSGQLEELEKLMIQTRWNALPRYLKALVTHDTYKRKLIDVERIETQFSPESSSEPMELVFGVTVQYETLDGDKREEYEYHKFSIRESKFGGYIIANFAVNQVFKWYLVLINVF